MASAAARGPEVPMEESLFAYSMSQCEQGWTWRLWDETGGVVAAGDAPDQPSAQRGLLEAYEKTRTAAVANEEDARHELPMDSRGRPETRGRVAGRDRRPGPAAARNRAAGPGTSARA
jgi:hypothetical protein